MAEALQLSPPLSRLEKESQIDRSRIEVGISNWHDLSYRDSRFQRPNPSITKRLLLARGHHCPHGAHRLCCLRPLLWPRNLASEELLLLLRVRTAIAMIMEEATTTSKQRKSNFLNPKGFPKKVLKDSLRTFQKEKIFASTTD